MKEISMDELKIIKDFLEVSQVIVRKTRLRMNMTQEQFANKTGYSQEYISEIENGKKYPSKEFFKKMITVFDFYKKNEHTS